MGDQAVQRQETALGQLASRQHVGRLPFGGARICASRMKAGGKGTDSGSL
jgi:hypothetical protein